VRDELVSRFQFVEDHRALFSIKRPYRVLGVSRSGFTGGTPPPSCASRDTRSTTSASSGVMRLAEAFSYEQM
jgi:hypothetical protein